MATVLELAYLSTAAYRHTFLENRVEVLGSNWTELRFFPEAPAGEPTAGDATTGFSASAFLGPNNEIVIAYTGTNDWKDWSMANVPAGLGEYNRHVLQALEFYLQIKQQFGDNITLTGHSLGGGLASLVAVFFNKQASTFDTAPFEMTATNAATVVQYHAALAAKGLGDQQFDDYAAAAAQVLAGGVNTNFKALFAAREAGVSHTYVTYEALAGLRTLWPSIVGSGKETSLDSGNASAHASQIDMHSMILCWAMLNNSAFAQEVRRLPHLVALINDDRLFSHDPRNKDQDIQALLMQREPQSGMLTRLAADLQQIGATIVDQAPSLADALIALTLAFYYAKRTSLEGDAGHAFAPIAGGLQLVLDSLDQGLRGNQRALELLADAVDALGGGNGTYRGLRDPHNGPQRLTISNGAALDFADVEGRRDLIVGLDANDVLSGGGADDILVGAGGEDSLYGGQGHDKLDGGTSDDILDGDAGNDELRGGAGQDVYEFTGNFGHDVIEDVDGGTIRVDGAPLPAGKRLRPGVWASADRSWLYSLADDGTSLVAARLADGSSITLRNWGGAAPVLGAAAMQASLQISPLASAGSNFGIQLDEAELAPPSTLPVVMGDFVKSIHNGRYQTDAVQNYVAVAGSEGTPAEDLLFGNADPLGTSNYNDHLIGGEANDLLDGRDGDDILEGGAGDDVLLGSSGSDWMFGGDGNDHISAAGVAYGMGDFAPVGMYPPKIPGDEFVPAPGTVYARGFGWALASTGLYGLMRFPLGFSTGSDVVDGGAGIDHIDAGHGDDLLSGGPGADGILGNGGADAIWGDEGDDYIFGDATVTNDPLSYLPAELHGADFISGGDGDDTLVGGGNADTLFGDAGNDVLHGDHPRDDDTPRSIHADDVIHGGSGNDVAYGQGGGDVLYGGADNDVLWGDDSIPADASDPVGLPAHLHGDDHLDGEEGIDELVGQGGNDTLFGGSDDDFLSGDDAIERLASSYHGNDYLDGEDGNDFVEGGGKGDTLYGGAGDDQLVGDAWFGGLDAADDGDDFLDGGDGADTLEGGGGSDTLLGGADNDQLLGDSPVTVVEASRHGADFLNGEDGDDILFGTGGDDILLGGEGDDQLHGDAVESDLAGGEHGDDHLDGESGADKLWGGGGDDLVFGGEGDDELSGDETGLAAEFHGNDTLDGGAGNDTMQGGGGADYLVGGDGDDQLTGDQLDIDASAHGADVLEGGAGNDSLWGQGGSDLLIGGAGNDAADGGTGDDVYEMGVGNDSTFDLLAEQGGGSDTYVFGRGDGEDIVFDQDTADHEDRIQLRGLFEEDVLFEREAGTSNLVVRIRDTGEALTVANHFFGGAASTYMIERFEFVDGMALDAQAVLARTRGQVHGSASGESLQGTTGNDALRGFDGDDILDGSAGADLLDGGAGNDGLIGGAGDDTFIFGRGYGRDSIGETAGAPGTDTVVLSGLRPSDVTFLYAGLGNDLKIQINGTDEYAFIYGYFGSATTVEMLKFASGETFDRAAVQARAVSLLTGDELANSLTGFSGNDRLEGRGGNDSLAGAAGDDTLVGGTGNDWSSGGTGNDTFVFERGDGRDTIVDESGVDDRVRFGAGIARQDLIFRARADLPASHPDYGGTGSNDLIVELQGGTDRLLIADFFTDGYGIESFDLADGTSISYANVVDAVPRLEVSPGPDLLRGTSAGDYIAALAGNDRIMTFAGDDVIDGGEGVDDISGGDGNDVIAGGADNDTLRGGSGNDRLDGEGSFDVLYGDGGDDVLFAGADGATLFGGDGNDTLHSGTGGNTAMFGGPGSDAYVLAAGMGSVTIDEAITGGDVDVARYVSGAPLDYTFTQGASQVVIAAKARPTDVLTIGNLWGTAPPEAVIDAIEFADGTRMSVNDLIRATIRVGNFADTMSGSGGDDIIDGLAGDDALYGHLGDDTLLGGAGDDRLTGGAGSDRLEGGAGDDTLLGAGGTGGTDGANLLVGGPGSDTITGGAGDDTVVFGRGDGFDSFADTSGGNDTLQFAAGILPAQVAVYRDGADVFFVVDASSTQVRINNFYTSGHRPIEQVAFDGGTGPVWTVADIEARAVTGTMNTMTGTAGNDVFVVDHAQDIVNEAPNAGVDEVRTSITMALPANVENMTAIGLLNLTLVGNALNNVLVGNTGNNTFRAGGGIDTAQGGAGDDTYYIERSTAWPFQATWVQPVENPGEGHDRLLQELGDWGSNHYSISLPANVEELRLGHSTSWWFNASTGTTTPRGGFGNELDNRIVGRPDFVNQLDGGAGRDELVGGSQGDVYFVDRNDDRIVDPSAGERNLNGYYDDRLLFDWYQKFAYGDVVVSTAPGYALPDRVENLWLGGATALNGFGNELANVMFGNEFANRLEGAGGDDTIYDQNLGFRLSGPYAQVVNDADTLIGGDGHDTLISRGGADTLAGGRGNDTLTAMTNATFRFERGDGHDVIHVASANGVGGTLAFADGIALSDLDFRRGEAPGTTNDLIIDVAGGEDRITVSLYFHESGSGRRGGIDRLLFADGSVFDRVAIDALFGIEQAPQGTDGNDVIVGTALADLIDAKGGDDVVNAMEGDDLVSGGAGDDTLDGGLGNDTLLGGQGNDTYVVDNSSDITTENASEGTDRVVASVTRTLGANLEHLTLSGTASINGTGNASSNHLQGNSGNNTLNGSGGIDVLQGGAGNDLVTDTSGRGLHDGGAGTDTLAGGTDRQFFAGGAGDDTLTLGGGADVVAFNRGNGADTINAPTSGAGAGETNDTVTLGGVRYSELRFARQSNDLLLKVAGTTDSIRFKNWYSSSGNRTVTRLQFIVDTTGDYNPASSDRLLNRRVVRLNFTSLVNAFNAAGSPTDWEVPAATFNSAYVAGSDTHALGGALAYRYARDGNFAGLDFATATATLSNSSFATAMQTFGAPTTGGVRLMRVESAPVTGVADSVAAAVSLMPAVADSDSALPIETAAMQLMTNSDIGIDASAANVDDIPGDLIRMPAGLLMEEANGGTAPRPSELVLQRSKPPASGDTATEWVRAQPVDAITLIDIPARLGPVALDGFDPRSVLRFLSRDAIVAAQSAPDIARPVSGLDPSQRIDTAAPEMAATDLWSSDPAMASYRLRELHPDIASRWAAAHASVQATRDMGSLPDLLGGEALYVPLPAFLIQAGNGDARSWSQAAWVREAHR